MKIKLLFPWSFDTINNIQEKPTTRSNIMSQEGAGVRGTEATQHIRRFAQRQALRMEIKFPGMKMCAGPTAYSMIKKEFNLKGNKQKVYDAFDKIVEANKPY
jgi:hypothetical protein